VSSVDAAERDAGIARGAALALSDDGYPEALRALSDPPSVLFASCDPVRLRELLRPPRVAIVGSRDPSAYGLEMAATLGRELARAGVVVVSGLARGIDARALEAAVAVGEAIAVLPAAVERPYPQRNARLARRIAARGALLSETDDPKPPPRWAFPRRNRIMAAIADAVIVVEARARSGTLITAQIALELGRPVGAVPGRATSPLARGANGLIRDGAFLVESADDVLDELFGPGWRAASSAGVHAQPLSGGAGSPAASVVGMSSPERPAQARDNEPAPTSEDASSGTCSPDASSDAGPARQRGCRRAATLTPAERHVLDGLAAGRTLGEIADRGALSPAEIRACAARLCALGVVVSTGLGRFEVVDQAPLMTAIADDAGASDRDTSLA